jgi:hypothetical protein
MREDDGVHVAVASLQAISASVKDLQAEKRRIRNKAPFTPGGAAQPKTGPSCRRCGIAA